MGFNYHSPPNFLNSSRSGKWGTLGMKTNQTESNNSKKVENYIFPHCLRYPILFQVICNKNQLHSFKIGASQATPKYTKDLPENTKENSKSQYFDDFHDLTIQKKI